MKHQFKFNPLATAILTLLCGGSIQSGFAAPADAVSTLDNKQLKATIQKTKIKTVILVKNFFSNIMSTNLHQKHNYETIVI
jgi:LPS-assembly protein